MAEISSVILACADFIDKYIRPFAYLFVSFFAVYFAIKKIGTKVTASFWFVSEGYSMGRIDKVAINNHKDKSVIVHSVLALVNNDMWLRLVEYDPPKILKPYEAIGVSTEEYSMLTLNGEDYELDPFSDKISIVIETESEQIFCKSYRKEPVEARYKFLMKGRAVFNGVVYTKRVRFILTYVSEGEQQTKFIGFNGGFGPDWRFRPNGFGEEPTVDLINKYLNDISFKSYVSRYELHKTVFAGPMAWTELVYESN